MLSKTCFWPVLLFLAVGGADSAKALGLSGTLPRSAAPQTGNEQIYVSMKPATGTPGSTLRTAVYLATARDVKLRTLGLRVSYPKGVLSFSKAEKGFLLQSGRFEVEAASAPHTSDSRLETVEIRIKADREDARAVLPTGLIVYVDFSVPKNAKPDVVVLQTEVAAAEAVDATRLSKSRWAADNQTVTIGGSNMVPIIACFFYMH